MKDYRCYYLDEDSLGEAGSFSASNDDDAERAALKLIAAARGQRTRYEVWQGTRRVCRTWARGLGR